MKRAAEKQFPDHNVGSTALPLWRLGDGPDVTAIIVSTEWFGFETHFWDGRTIACPGPDECLLCEKALVKRWAGTIVIGRSGRRGFDLFPFTKSIIPDIRSALMDYGSLKGVVATFGRRMHFSRLRMLCTIVEQRPYHGAVYTREQTRAATERIFGRSDVLLPASHYTREQS